MKITICDSENASREILISYIHQFSRTYAMVVSILEYASGEALLHAVKDNFSPTEFDFLFLEIHLTGMNGIMTAQELRDIGYEGALVIISTSPSYALEGYQVYADGYLIKPVEYEQFEKVMLHVCKRRKGDFKSISLSEGRVQYRILYKDICYIEAQGRYMIIHTMDAVIRYRINMCDLASILCEEPNFLRCHRGYLVNMNYIDFAEPEYLLMKNQERVPIHIKESRKIRQKIADYLFHSV
jgi:two-component system response regulator LytT